VEKPHWLQRGFSFVPRRHTKLAILFRLRGKNGLPLRRRGCQEVLLLLLLLVVVVVVVVFPRRLVSKAKSPASLTPLPLEGEGLA
jgi:hypothetical protein